VGNANRRLSKMDTAIYYYQQSQSAFEEINPTLVWKPLIGMGRTYTRLNEFKRAIPFFAEAYDLVKDTGTRAERGYALFFFADTHRILKNFDEYFDALEEWERFQAEKKTSGVPGDSPHASLVRTFYRGDTSIIGYYQDAVEHFNKQGNSFRESWAYYDLGISGLHLERYDLAREAFNNVLNIEHDKEGVRRQNIESNHGLYRAEKGLGNFEAALTYLEKYDSLMIDIQFEALKNNIAQLEVEYETAKKEVEIQKRTSQRNILLVSSILLALLAIAIFLIFRQRIRINTQIAAQESELKEQRIAQLEQEKQLSAYNAMLNGQEKERLRIARDLHDSLGGLLTTVKAHFNSLKPKQLKQDTAQIYDKTNQLIDEAHVEVRRISHNMVPRALADHGLKGALEDLAENVESDGLKVNLELIGDLNQIPQSKALIIFRTIQELTNNIRKHAKAKTVLIQLVHKVDQLSIFVEDDGVGFDLNRARKKEGIGLENIDSRVHFLQGSIDWDSIIGEGTTVSIEVPLLQEKFQPSSSAA